MGRRDGVEGGGYRVGQLPRFADGRFFGGADDDGDGVFAGMQIGSGVGLEAPEHVFASADESPVEVHFAHGVDDLGEKPHGFQSEKLL